MGVVKTGTPVPGLGVYFGDIDISQLFFYTFAKASTTSLRLYDDSRNYTEFKGTNFGYSVDAFGNFVSQAGHAPVLTRLDDKSIRATSPRRPELPTRYNASRWRSKSWFFCSARFCLISASSVCECAGTWYSR